MSDVTLHIEPPSSPDARACVARYVLELSRRFDMGYDPSNAAPTDDAQFTPPDGAFLVARLDGRAVGCGALKRPLPDTGEIKRLWIDPGTRGLRIGRGLLTALEDRARGMGLSRVRLDSNLTLTEALALYRTCGYAEVARFNDDPYAQMWFEKVLP
ncbi:GNAT family N-acetyltransferase [Asticcacaulis solisilvae]|uniref:GNAT family N-acetyltransferase n=1 Tax=Asticcacaulis solisilvae TaxID=1217274 RepID=UPI003FD76E34